MDKTHKEFVEKREVSCDNGHNEVTFKSKLKVPICPVCRHEVEV